MLDRKKILRIWFVILLLSFAYEKPLLILSSMDRLNPRLFDIVSFFGVLIWPLTRQIGTKNIILKKWKYIIWWFGICCFFTVAFYNFDSVINNFSIFFYIQYLQELFVLYIAARILSEGFKVLLIMKIFLISGVFLFLYSIYELNFGKYGVLEFAPGKFTTKPEGVIWGPFGNTYFQIANYIPFIFIMIIAFSTSLRGFNKKFVICFSLISAFPLLYTGSRTGIGLLVLTVSIFFFLYLKKVKVHYLILFLVAFSVFHNITDQLGTDSNKTFERLEEMEENKSNSIGGRFLYFLDFDLSSYADNGVYVPYFGAGFYVAPIKGNFRIGYGFHNIYVFAFEQAGLIGLILFILFLKQSINSLRKRIRYYKNRDVLSYSFTIGIYSFLIAEVILGIAGHTFWRGFATNNMNTLRILMLIIATSPLIYKKEINEKNIISK